MNGFIFCHVSIPLACWTDTTFANFLSYFARLDPAVISISCKGAFAGIVKTLSHTDTSRPDFREATMLSISPSAILSKFLSITAVEVYSSTSSRSISSQFSNSLLVTKKI